MAQTAQNTAPQGSQAPQGEPAQPETAATAWAKAAADRKYGIHNGKPLVASKFPAKEIGYIASVDAPEWFTHVPTNQRPFVAAALLEMLQNRAGATSKPNSQKDYHDAIVKLLNANGDASRAREKDAISLGVESELVALCLDANPSAAPGDLDFTVAKHASAYMAKHRDRILRDGFRVSKQNKATKAVVKEIPIAGLGDDDE